MTRKRHLTSALTALAVGSSALVAATVPAQAQAAEGPLGKTSLAKVLAADGAGFDKNSRDFDILDNAVRAVLAEKPKSPVSVLAKGRVKLTAFAPIDGAFRRLVLDVTGEHYRSEKRVFTELAAAADIDTIESVLLYHVVPGAVITSKAARHSDGAKLTTALEDGTVRVNVRRDGRVFLVDADTNDANPRLIRKLKNLNQGNRQIAHGISQVLRPLDL
ncbi:fasciclin domain-containing protein [Nocardioides sp. WL0053]|uniref:Fasciclin domain-containing protein n=1 Tax=Nocardioides jiangsuensis TaxID=2866161 RepID=A0ABS7RH69_9ACTN|nr:fasciclin domain-containing protein [Nocardioides jiangsuensis]MBY9074374.1 fasciclin domain-containing protein [Nocardioides jiangsuensis]